MMGSRLYFRFSDEEQWSSKMNSLFSELKNIGILPQSHSSSLSLYTSPSLSTASSSIPPSSSPFLPSPSLSPSLPSIKMMLQWEEKEVEEWLTKSKLATIIPIFKKNEMDGASMIELRDILLNDRHKFLELLEKMGVSIGVTMKLATSLKMFGN